MDIVQTVVVDQTRPVIQKGFKRVAIFDFTQERETEMISDIKAVEGGTKLYDLLSVYFANGGKSIVVSGVKVEDAARDIPALMSKVEEVNEYYLVTAVVPKELQAEYYPEIVKYCNGNEKLSILESNGEPEDIIMAYSDLNTDRCVIYANKMDEQEGKAMAALGACAPQDEGSITWGNVAIVGTGTSKYSLSEESQLIAKFINYITKTKGYILTQFGRTLSGSHADITRSKDWLKNRCDESLTSLLVNNKKIAYTKDGLDKIKSTLEELGQQAVDSGMLISYEANTPKLENIPVTDKQNRVLNGVEFVCKLAVSMETLNISLIVVL